MKTDRHFGLRHKPIEHALPVVFLQFAFLLTLLSSLVSCGKTTKASDSGTGGITAQTVWVTSIPQAESAPETLYAAPPETAQVRMIVTGSGMSAESQSFNAAGPGTISGIPAGPGRTLAIKGLDSGGNVIYQGSVSNINVIANNTTNAGTVTMTPVQPRTIGGVVSGLAGSTLVLVNNGGNTATITANGGFTFSQGVQNGSTYDVTVLTQPSGLTCTVTNGSGTASADVTNVIITCSKTTYTVGGFVSGLAGTVVLQNNGGEDKTISANGSFTFATPAASGSSYNVTVLTQPSGQACSIANGTGTASSNITDVTITCAAKQYTVGGSISGLFGSVVLQNNGSDNLTVSANGTFTFPTALADGSTYSVSVLTQPSGLICSVGNSSGTVAGAAVTSMSVTCSASTFGVGGSISGLAGTVVLQNSGGDNLTRTTNGSFTFPTKVAFGAPYAVTVLSQPEGQACSVVNGSGTVVGAVTSVSVTCSSINYSVGGSATGLTGALVLQDNGADNLTITANGAFTFPAQLASGSSYDVTVSSYPAGQVCTVTNGSGTISGNVTNVTLACSTVSPGSKAYITKYGQTDNSVSVMDLKTNQVIKTITVGSAPTGVAVNPVIGRAYVTNTGYFTQGTTVSVIDTTSDTVGATIAVGKSPRGVAVDPYYNKVYVTNSDDNTVSVIDSSTDTVISTISVGMHPWGVAVNPSARRAYVANYGSDTISVIDTSTDTVLTTITVGSWPGEIAIDAGAHRAYVTNVSPKSVSVIDTTNNTVIETITKSVDTGLARYGVCINPSTKRAYVTNDLSGTVSVIDTNTNTEIQTIAADAGAWDIEIDTSSNKAYITTNSGKFIIIDTVSNSVISSLDLGGYNVALVPDRQNTGITQVRRYGVHFSQRAVGTCPSAFSTDVIITGYQNGTFSWNDEINYAETVLVAGSCGSADCSGVTIPDHSWSYTASGDYIAFSNENINVNFNTGTVTGTATVTAPADGFWVGMGNPACNGVYDISGFLLSAQ